LSQPPFPPLPRRRPPPFRCGAGAPRGRAGRGRVRGAGGGGGGDEAGGPPPSPLQQRTRKHVQGANLPTMCLRHPAWDPTETFSGGGGGGEHQLGLAREPGFGICAQRTLEIRPRIEVCSRKHDFITFVGSLRPPHRCLPRRSVGYFGGCMYSHTFSVNPERCCSSIRVCCQAMSCPSHPASPPVVA
jgi:hypothetical protein